MFGRLFLGTFSVASALPTGADQGRFEYPLSKLSEQKDAEILRLTDDGVCETAVLPDGLYRMCGSRGAGVVAAGARSHRLLKNALESVSMASVSKGYERPRLGMGRNANSVGRRRYDAILAGFKFGFKKYQLLKHELYKQLKDNRFALMQRNGLGSGLRPQETNLRCGQLAAPAAGVSIKEQNKRSRTMVEHIDAIVTGENSSSTDCRTAKITRTEDHGAVGAPVFFSAEELEQQGIDADELDSVVVKVEDGFIIFGSPTRDSEDETED